MRNSYLIEKCGTWSLSISKVASSDFICYFDDFINRCEINTFYCSRKIVLRENNGIRSGEIKRCSCESGLVQSKCLVQLFQRTPLRLLCRHFHLFKWESETIRMCMLESRQYQQHYLLKLTKFNQQRFTPTILECLYR